MAHNRRHEIQQRDAIVARNDRIRFQERGGDVALGRGTTTTTPESFDVEAFVNDLLASGLGGGGSSGGGGLSFSEQLQLARERGEIVGRPLGVLDLHSDEALDLVDQLGESTHGGMYIPDSVLRYGKRDLNVELGTQGGVLVAEDYMPGSFIDLLRNNMVTVALGVTSMDGLVGDVAIPKHTTAGTSYWIAEGAAPTESTQDEPKAAIWRPRFGLRREVRKASCLTTVSTSRCIT